MIFFDRKHYTTLFSICKCFFRIFLRGNIGKFPPLLLVTLTNFDEENDGNSEEPARSKIIIDKRRKRIYNKNKFVLMEAKSMERDLLKKIEGTRPSFSKGQRAIADYILQHYDKAAYMTAAGLGEKAKVSESTVVRFAAELGFEGYPELQKALQEMVRIRLNAVQRVELTNSIIGEGDVLTKVLDADIARIRQTLEGIDRKAFDRAISHILGAGNIYIIGVRSSAFLAGFLNYNFRMIFDNVRFVQTTSGSEMFEQLLNLNEKDVMIAISFPRYSKRIINAVEFARQKKTRVIALTDGEQSPIAGYADELLVAHSDMVSFVDSLAAPLSIINAMIAEVVRRKQGEFSKKLHELEEIWDKYDVYDKA